MVIASLPFNGTIFSFPNSVGPLDGLMEGLGNGNA